MSSARTALTSFCLGLAFFLAAPGMSWSFDLSELQLRAEMGNVKAQYNLGWMYQNGRGVEQDDQEALRWFRLAAEQGHSGSQFFIGLGYAEKRGVPQDYKEAVRWFRLAAEQGHPLAQSFLGGMYYFGRGVAQDYTYAHMWSNFSVANAETDSIKAHAIELRDRVVRSITPKQLELAQELAQECVGKSYKGC